MIDDFSGLLVLIPRPQEQGAVIEAEARGAARQ